MCRKKGHGLIGGRKRKEMEINQMYIKRSKNGFFWGPVQKKGLGFFGIVKEKKCKLLKIHVGVLKVDYIYCWGTKSRLYIWSTFCTPFTE